ncbi:MAG: hypothetical protein U1F68_09225 [Gammaproteobacteria bacterium]
MRYSFVQIAQPDFVTLCRAGGDAARRVEARVELEAIAEPLANAGPFLLDVAVAPMANSF